MLGHWDLMLDVLRKALVGDHKDYDFESLGTEVDEVKDGLVLELIQAPYLEDDEALAFAHLPQRKVIAEPSIELLGRKTKVKVCHDLPLHLLQLLVEIVQYLFSLQIPDDQLDLLSFCVPGSKDIGLAAVDLIPESG